MTNGELILYQTDDGRAEIQLRAMDGSVWLTQAEIAALFDTSPQAITQLIRTVYDDAELTPEATCKDFLQVRITMHEWIAQTDRFLDFNERAVLDHAGKISHEAMSRIAHDRYATFDGSRKEAEALAAEAEHEQEWRAIEAEVTKKVSKMDKDQ
ncbi:MAG: hypothetical protein GVY13_03890 [Alphaproteobacteria bacterium]|nr:hypothetical protein [Alphaproteobacteria bacterium]